MHLICIQMSLSKQELQRNYLRACYRAKENEVKYKKGEECELVYENQKVAAVEICQELFEKGKTVVTLIPIRKLERGEHFSKRPFSRVRIQVIGILSIRTMCLLSLGCLIPIGSIRQKMTC